MKTDRSVWVYCGIALATLLLLAAAYVGAYYALVRPEPCLVDVGGISTHPVTVILPQYPRVAGIDCDLLFRPIHRLDRSLRPLTWVAR